MTKEQTWQMVLMLPTDEFNAIDVEYAFKMGWDAAMYSVAVKSASMSVTKDVIDDLNKKLGSHYKPTTASKRMIDARIKEGFTKQDFFKVHDNMIAEWGEDEKMSQYLRPATLYCASKFEGYLNKKVATKSPNWM